MRLQCCAHDKSHACGSLFCSSFINIPLLSHLHHSLPREREPRRGKRRPKVSASATAPRTLSSRSLRLATVRRLTRILYMSMDNVSTRFWRGAPRSCRVRARCFPGVTSRCHKSRLRSKRLLAELQITRKRSTTARTSIHPVNQVERCARPQEIACTAILASCWIAATPLPKSLHHHCHRAGDRLVRSRWARSKAPAPGYRFRGACTSP